METLLPSEVARLVYGYLVEQNCQEAADKFLETSPHLKECLLASRKGKKFQTRFEGRNLVAILDVLSQVKTQAQIVAAELPQNSLLNKKLLDLLSLLSVEVGPSADSDDEGPAEATLEEDNRSSPFEAAKGVDEIEEEVVKVFKNVKPPNSFVRNEPSKDRRDQSNRLNPEPVTASTQLQHNKDDAHRGGEKSNRYSESNTELMTSAVGDESIADAVVESPPSPPKRMKLDDSDSDEPFECVGPVVEVIELDEDEDLMPSSKSVDRPLVRTHEGPSSSNSSKSKEVNSSKSVPRTVPNVSTSNVHGINLSQACSSRPVTSQSNHQSKHSARANNSSSAYKGPTLIKASLPTCNPHLLNLQAAHPRFIAPPTSQPLGPVHTSAGFARNSWLGSSSALLSNASLPTVPLIANRHIIQASSFGGMVSGTNNIPQRVQVITKKVVTQVISSGQSAVSQSYVANHTLIRPRIPMASTHNRSIPIVNPLTRLV